MRAVLDDRDAARRGERADRSHRLREPEVMRDEHRADVGQVIALERRERDFERRRERKEERLGAAEDDRLDHRQAVVRGHQHAMAGTDTEPLQRESDRDTGAGHVALVGQRKHRRQRRDTARLVGPRRSRERRPPEHGILRNVGNRKLQRQHFFRGHAASRPAWWWAGRCASWRGSGAASSLWVRRAPIGTGRPQGRPRVGPGCDKAANYTIGPLRRTMSRTPGRRPATVPGRPADGAGRCVPQLPFSRTPP